LAQWATLDARPTAWVSLSESDNDAPALLAHMLFALEASTALGAEHFEAIALSVADLARVVLPRFGAVVADAAPTVWMLDDVHVLRSDAALRVVRVLLEHASAGSTVVLAGRRAPELPIARRRAGRAVLDVGLDDLTMSEREAAALLRAAGATLRPGDVGTVVSRTEGWPAGLYLSSLVQRDGGDVARLGSDDRAIAEYLLDEVLRVTTDDQATFLTRSAIFEMVTASACDAVLERDDAAALLDALERSNLFVHRVGPNRDAYRYHQLFRDLLLAELRRRESATEHELHRRASAWFESQGDIDGAIEHARASGDTDRVADLVWANVAHYIGIGRTATVQRWLEAFSPSEIAARPSLALSAAWVAFTDGDSTEMERWATVLHTHDLDGQLSDGIPQRAAVALVDALVSKDGLRASLADAEVAYTEHGPGTPYRPLAGLVAGIAARLLGDTDAAGTWCEEALQLGVVLPPVQSQAAAQMARLAADAGLWADAMRHIDVALQIVEQYGFEERAAMCQVYATAGYVRAHEGRADAKDLVKHGVWLVSSLRGVARFAALDARILLARTLATLGELDLARELVNEAAALIAAYPDPGVLPEMLAQARARIAAAEHPLGMSASPLTPAELRVLRYLPTHLSFAEIADVVFVSRNTVKTQAIAVYRKLGVTSRAAAVDRARAAGLLDP
ncbi:MAG TPA: LuxR C-terminal-related transcriptional regulator, partial [Acidimicrobiia bacterium]|nr:LuxR C-terminal-related transcriptional regulator [Acidimicrobiia bacterium]